MWNARNWRKLTAENAATVRAWSGEDDDSAAGEAAIALQMGEKLYTDLSRISWSDRRAGGKMRRKAARRQICAGKEVDDSVPVTGVLLGSKYSQSNCQRLA